MDKFIPYEKLSKKEQRERNKARRSTWGAVNPVTRKPANPKAYNRQKARRWKYDPPERAFSLFAYKGVKKVPNQAKSTLMGITTG